MLTDSGVFDYIVVGAGSAGCVLAARLSESGRHTVLLLEAGGRDWSPWIHLPMGYARLYADPTVNWMYASEPERQLADRTIFQPRGKVLGGTSSINGMLYMRGHPADYDAWRQRGCLGWDWESVLPYFKKAEDQERGTNDFHAVGGPLRVSDQTIRFELAERWVAAAVQAGLVENSDFNGAQQDGAGLFQTTTKRGRRWSAAAAYLRPARGRANLAVVTGAHATKVFLEDGRAKGVAYLHHGVPHVARARGEVVISGGVFNSPQLLQLSGIGPGRILRELGIPVIRELRAVGSNLQDHFSTRLQFRCTRPITLNDVANSAWRKIVAGLQYLILRSGPLASNGISAGGFVRSDPLLERPDLQLNFTNWSFANRDHTGVRAHPFSAFGVNSVHLRPDARGTVQLKSPDPLAPPEIRFNFLKTQNDLRVMITGVRIVRTISQQPALAPYVAEELLPGPSVRSDADFEHFVRSYGVSNLHPVGTCGMGLDDNSAVNERLRVRGVSNLRVVDASIMPTVPAGNTNAPTIMIAEKASDMILHDAKAM
jgi:choline dehydrogenase